MLASLDSLNYNEDINRAWENVEESIKTSAKENQVCANWSNIIHVLMKN